VDRDDIYFGIGTALALLAFFGVDWKRIKKSLAQRGETMPKTPFPKRQILFLALIVASLVMSSIGWYVSYSNKPQTYEEFSGARKKLEEVRLQTFVNEVVELDGKHFIDCDFLHVTLIYRGHEPFVMDVSKFTGPLSIVVQDGPAAGPALLVDHIMAACKREPRCDFENMYALTVLRPDQMPKPQVH